MDPKANGPSCRPEYERKIAKRFGGQQELELVVPGPKTEPEDMASPGPLFDHMETKEAAD
jgi:hypothetical protein